jgi:methanogenic corrinoid protein MtbC1
MPIQSMSENSVGQHNGAVSRRTSEGEGGGGATRSIHQQVADQHLLSLVRAVEGEIVPRLLLARRGTARLSLVDNGASIQDSEPPQLARLLLVQEIAGLYVFVEAIHLRGVGERDLYLKLLAPAARLLGEMWDRDECDFMQVAIGLGRLHQLLQRVSLLTPGPDSFDSRGHGRRALLATVPGETHCFGVMMVSQFFRQNGWDVFNEFPASEAELCSCVHAQSFAIVGLSAGSETQIDTLSAAVRAVRRSSLNAAVGVIVGGPLLHGRPELAARVGADATAEDGEQAARLAESVCALLAGEK